VTTEYSKHMERGRLTEANEGNEEGQDDRMDGMWKRFLRNLPLLPEFVVRWEFPLVRSAPELNPEALRRPQSKNKVFTDREFVEQVLTETSCSRGTVVKTAGEMGISSATADRYLKRLSKAGVIGCGGGLYWRLAA